jgi:hypothetical protein
VTRTSGGFEKLNHFDAAGGFYRKAISVQSFSQSATTIFSLQFNPFELHHKAM